MGILALVSLMALHLVIERAPDCLEVEHVEVCILLHLVQQIYGELFLAVCESAHVAKVTRVDIARPLIAELGLVFLGVVEGLDPIVGLRASVTIWTATCLCKLAHLATVGSQGSSLVLVVVEPALLLVVPTVLRARLGLEDAKVEQLHAVPVGRPVRVRGRAAGGRDDLGLGLGLRVSLVTIGAALWERKLRGGELRVSLAPFTREALGALWV